MNKLSCFKFSSIHWVSNVSIFGYKMKLEKLNLKKQIGVKCLESYRNYKLTLQEISKMKFFNRKTFFLTCLVATEIASLIYFKLLRFKTENKYINEIYNHEKTFDYILNILTLRIFGTVLCLKNPFKANLILLVTSLGIVPLLTLLNNKMRKFISMNYHIENFSMFNDNNVLTKVVFCSALAKFLKYFISDKIWKLKFLKFNRKHVFTLFSTFFLIKISSFLSLFMSDNINLGDVTGIIGIIIGMMFYNYRFLFGVIPLVLFNPYNAMIYFSTKNNLPDETLDELNLNSKTRYERFLIYIKFQLLLISANILEIYF